LGGLDQSLGTLAPTIEPHQFFFWGYLKDLLSCQKVDVVELHACINKAVAYVTPQMLENT
jgi:hypothetical protein